ncbi:flavo protein-like protein [Kockovaella imperatae]|uniref:Flavo protein-like protein n=1 Tax=Kockovaella imperatae TaxID=4999 RepID=A0A1Y1UJW6_9TREE|nr:flavo protein-like protein [Kockovaella imperatae]ORX38351.1 flavo protein-like protein [Kockovaella imperatae]
MASRLPLHIGILLGSARSPNNTSGFYKLVRQHLERLAPGSKISAYDPFTAPLPLGPYVMSAMASTLKPERREDGFANFGYPDPRVQEWSQIVQDLDALIIITPQYNWSFPSTIKEAVDHLYYEWANLPFATVNFGGMGGGDKCASALDQVIRGVHGNPVSTRKITIKLDPKYFNHDHILSGDEDFLKEHSELLDQEMRKVISAAKERQHVKKEFIMNAPAWVAEEKAKARAASQK